MKKWVLPFILCIVLVSTFIMPEHGEARSDLERINQELAELKAMQNAAKKKADEAERQILNVKSQKVQVKQDIEQLLAQIDDAGKELAELEVKIADQEAELEEAEWQIKEVEQRIVDRDEKLKSRLRLMYTNGSVSYLEVLMNSRSFTDFLDRFRKMEQLVGQDKELIIAQKEDLALINEQRDYIAVLLTGLTEDYERVEELKQSLIVKEKDREVMIASLNQQQQALEYITEEMEKEAVAYAAKIAKKMEEKEKLEVFYQGGKLGYPLPKLYPVTSPFGYRTNPVTGQRGELHKGIDFGAPTGTNVLAAEQGRVITAGWVRGYGYTVILDHGGGVWTWYCHMSKISVKEGAIVKKGGKVGEVGSTGQSTGPHLHFNVYVNQQPVDPAPYLNLK